MCRAQDSPAPHVAALLARRLGAHQELGQLTPAAPKMSHTTGRCAQRYQPDGRVGGMFQVMVFVFPMHCYM